MNDATMVDAPGDLHLRGYGFWITLIVSHGNHKMQPPARDSLGSNHVDTNSKYRNRNVEINTFDIYLLFICFIQSIINNTTFNNNLRSGRAVALTTKARPRHSRRVIVFQYTVVCTSRDSAADDARPEPRTNYNENEDNMNKTGRILPTTESAESPSGIFFYSE